LILTFPILSFFIFSFIFFSPLPGVQFFPWLNTKSGFSVACVPPSRVAEIDTSTAYCFLIKNTSIHFPFFLSSMKTNGKSSRTFIVFISYLKIFSLSSAFLFPVYNLTLSFQVNG